MLNHTHCHLCLDEGHVARECPTVCSTVTEAVEEGGGVGEGEETPPRAEGEGVKGGEGGEGEEEDLKGLAKQRREERKERRERRGEGSQLVINKATKATLTTRASKHGGIPVGVVAVQAANAEAWRKLLQQDTGVVTFKGVDKLPGRYLSPCHYLSTMLYQRWYLVQFCLQFT